MSETWKIYRMEGGRHLKQKAISSVLELSMRVRVVFLILLCCYIPERVLTFDSSACPCGSDQPGGELYVGSKSDGVNVSAMWKRIPLIEGRPAVLYIEDNTIYSTIRTAAHECWLNAEHPPWEEERGQMTQGGAIDLWFHQALRSYPHQTRTIERADIIIHHLPLTLLYQLRTGSIWASSCHHLSAIFQNYLKGSTKTRGYEAYATVSKISQQSGGPKILNHSMWIGAYFGTTELSTEFSARINALNVKHFVGMGFSNYGWPKWTSIPSTSNHAIEKLIRGCPCLVDQEKSIPFYFKGSMRYNKGGELRQKLQALKWESLFPGSIVELTSQKFVQIQSSEVIDAFSNQYAREITSAKYCLIVQGDTPDVRRLFEAIIAGCVPVLITEWDERLPYNWLLNGQFYQRLTLRIRLNLVLENHRQSELETALERIWAISPQSYQELRSNMKAHAAELIWGFGSPLNADHTLFGYASVNAFVESTLRIYSRCPTERIRVHEAGGQVSELCLS